MKKPLSAQRTGGLPLLSPVRAPATFKAVAVTNHAEPERHAGSLRGYRAPPLRGWLRAQPGLPARYGGLRHIAPRTRKKGQAPAAPAGPGTAAADVPQRRCVPSRFLARPSALPPMVRRRQMPGAEVMYS